MRTFVTPPSDRTPFKELVAIVADFLRQEVPTCSPTRPVYLLGESFGGLLALAVAAGEPARRSQCLCVSLTAATVTRPPLDRCPMPPPRLHLPPLQSARRWWTAWSWSTRQPRTSRACGPSLARCCPT